VIVERHGIGLNPKINNLHNIYPHSHYDYIAISDSNVRVAPDYLKKLMSILRRENVGLVTASFRGMNAKKLGSVFENLHLNTFIAGGVLVASRLFKIPVSIGKSMLMKRTTIEKIGGFANFRNYLAEDYFMSKAVAKLGFHIVNSAYFIETVNEDWSWRYFMNRHTRWAQMRKTTNRLYYLAEILSYPIAISLIYAFYLWNLAGMRQLCLVVGLKIVMDTALGKIVGSDLRWHQYLLIPIKDVFVALLWCVPFVNSRINWRGNHFKIIKDTQLIPLMEAT
jgi:ceramide glucosyltransferase